MKQGYKILIGGALTIGIGAIVYFMFFKKDSPIYVLKPKVDDGDNDSDEGTPPTGLNVPIHGAPPSSPAPAVCPHPATPFKSKSEGDAFRDWVNDEHSDIAKRIDLDRTGQYDNCYIRTAFAYKVSGRSLGNTYLAIQASEPESQPTERNNFEYFIQRLRDRSIPFRINNQGFVLILIHSEQNDMDDYFYQFAFSKDGTWAAAMWYQKPFQTEATLIAKGLYNLDEPKAGTKLTITSGTDRAGVSMKGWTRAANNDNVWVMEEVIQKYWQPNGMTESSARSLEAVSNF